MAARKSTTKKSTMTKAEQIAAELAEAGLAPVKRGPTPGSSNARTEAQRAKVRSIIEKAEKAGKATAMIPAADFDVTDDQVKTYVKKVVAEMSGWEYHTKMADKNGSPVFVVANL